MKKSENINWLDVVKIVWEILGIIIEVLTGQSSVAQGKAQVRRRIALLHESMRREEQP